MPEGVRVRVPLSAPIMTRWSNGRAVVCKTAGTGSIPVRVSIMDRASGARRQSVRLLIGGLWVRIPPGAPIINGIKRVVARAGLSGSLGRRRGVTPTRVRIPHHPPWTTLEAPGMDEDPGLNPGIARRRSRVRFSCLQPNGAEWRSGSARGS